MTSEEFQIADKVEYEDAYTGELKYGIITQMYGGTVMISNITEKEAGPTPKRLPKARIACTFARSEDGIPICRYHHKALGQLAVHGDSNPPGLGHFSAWICPESGKQVYDAGF